jgi:cell fate (sporulation/competence/biofilm development) regulator YlbF (YheA/YmcA/DUF963 family)
MNNTLSQQSPDLMVATDQLAEAIKQSEPMRRYQQAQADLEADAQASTILEQLTAVQVELRQRQMNGRLTQADIQQARALQSEAQTNGLIMAFVQTQQQAMASLNEVNDEISQLLGLNFAALSQTNSC